MVTVALDILNVLRFLLVWRWPYLLMNLSVSSIPDRVAGLLGLLSWTRLRHPAIDELARMCIVLAVFLRWQKLSILAFLQLMSVVPVVPRLVPVRVRLVSGLLDVTVLDGVRVSRVVTVVVRYVPSSTGGLFSCSLVCG